MSTSPDAVLQYRRVGHQQVVDDDVASLAGGGGDPLVEGAHGLPSLAAEAPAQGSLGQARVNRVGVDALLGVRAVVAVPGRKRTRQEVVYSEQQPEILAPLGEDLTRRGLSGA